MRLRTTPAALLALCLSGAAWALPVCERTPQWLHLHKNRLTELPAGAFDGLASLQGLWIGNNCLAQPFDYFNGIRHVLGLDEQDDPSACEQPEAVEAVEPEARSFWHGWRLILLERT